MAQQDNINHSQELETSSQSSGFSLSDINTSDLPPMIGSGALVLYGLSRRSLGGLFLAGIGGGLLYRQIQKQIDSDDRPKSSQLIELEETVIVQQPIEDVFAFWSDLQNLPRFMDHIKSIHKLDDIRSHWQAFIPFTEQVIEWDAEISEFHPNELIRWQSTPDSDIYNEGTIHFQRLPNGNGTRVHATICYRPPAASAGRVAAQFLNNIPQDFIKTDMERFRRLLESTYPNSGVIDNDISF